MPQTETFRGSILVPLELPAGWDEDRLDEAGAAEVARVARDAGYTTNAQAARAADEAAVLVDGDYVPESALTAPAAPLAPRCRIVTWEAVGERNDAPQALTVTAGRVGERTCAAALPFRLASPVVILAVRHDLDTLAVTVRLYRADGSLLHPQAANPITRDEVEVIASGETCRVVIEADEEETAGDGPDTDR
jgi:hypothetical protein